MNAAPPIEAFTDLLDIPHKDCDCWDLTVRGLRRFGVVWPADWQEFIASPIDRMKVIPPAAAVRAGDVVELREKGSVAHADRHVALVIAAGRHGLDAEVLHTSSRLGSRRDKLSVLRKVMDVVQVVRPLELEGCA